MLSKFDGLVSGLLVGLITASLGAIKDSPHEGFKPKTFFRSPIIAAGYGVIGALAFKNNDSLVLNAAFASVCERVTVETWKAIGGKTPGKFEWGANRDRGWLVNSHSNNNVPYSQLSDSDITALLQKGQS